MKVVVAAIVVAIIGNLLALAGLIMPHVALLVPVGLLNTSISVLLVCLILQKLLKELSALMPKK